MIKDVENLKNQILQLPTNVNSIGKVSVGDVFKLIDELSEPFDNKKDFYQVHYGGGEWEDRWEEVSCLYSSKEQAIDFIKRLGFKKVTLPNGRTVWEQQDELNDDGYDPHWVRIKLVNVSE